MRVPSLFFITIIYYFLRARNFWKLVKAMMSILHFKKPQLKNFSFPLCCEFVNSDALSSDH